MQGGAKRIGIGRKARTNVVSVTAWNSMLTIVDLKLFYSLGGFLRNSYSITTLLVDRDASLQFGESHAQYI